MISHILLSAETTLLLSVASLYIVNCPFNKVEESFNTQAVHDIVNIFPKDFPHSDLARVNQVVPSELEIAIRAQLPWDHIQFPGVVPRTFVGAFIIGLPLKLAKYFMSGGYISADSFLETSNPKNVLEPDLTTQFVLQIGSRFALSSLVVLSLSAVTRAIHKRYGLLFKVCFLLVTIGQFHYMFYAGRFIPNTFAAILANLVFASWINRQYSKSVIYIALCVIIFRFDTSIFFGVLVFDAIFIRRCLTLGRVLRVGIPSGLVAILITFTTDSIFWARPVWPELEGLYFNLWLNKSHEWGTQPYFWYIYSCIPRILMASTPLLLLAEHKITRDYLIPTLAFIFIYSLLPHKELRFILFVTPFLNICVASGLMNVYFYLNKIFTYIDSISKPSKETATKRSESKSTQLGGSKIATCIFFLIMMGMLTANIFICYILSHISSHNYPGGHAAISLGTTKELLDKVQKSIGETGGMHDPRSDVAVYVNNLAAQTGMSRFVQVDGVYYSKTSELDSNTFKKSYSLIYLILEPKEVMSFLKSNCPFVDEGRSEQWVNKWISDQSETKCNMPNQHQMYCSAIDKVGSFQSVNYDILIKRFKKINSYKSIVNSLLENGFIKTRMALIIMRCSTRSKHNPFA